jgi:hypothetical protein
VLVFVELLLCFEVGFEVGFEVAFAVTLLVALGDGFFVAALAAGETSANAAISREATSFCRDPT